MQLRRNILFAIMIILFLYFEIHSCSHDTVTAPEPDPEISDLVCDAVGLFFLDEDNGWVTGMHGTVMRTSDGGDSWCAARLDDVRLNDIHFIDLESGWIVGHEGTLYRSRDGGGSWERMPFTGIPQDSDLFRVQFMDHSLGFIQGYHGVYRTVDGGSTWENHWLPIVPYRGSWGMSMLDATRGYLLGSRWTDEDPELIYRTDDGGVHWSKVLGSNASMLQAVLTITFVDRLNGWAGGGAIRHTGDGGGNWTVQLEPATVRDFHFRSAEYGFAAGGSTILRTTDGGRAWEDVTPDDPRVVDLRSIWFIDDDTGWIVGRGNERRSGTRVIRVSILLKTTDRGDSWSILEFPFDFTEYSSEPQSVSNP